MSTGKLGSADLAANTDTLLGTADETMIVNVRLVNRGAMAAVVRLAIGAGVAPAAADYFEYDAVISPKGILENGGLALSAGEKIWVRSDSATVSARAHGVPAA
jgi:hypothetical protein